MKSCTTSWNNVQLELQSLKALRYGMIYARIEAKKYISIQKKINNVTNTVIVQRIELGFLFLKHAYSFSQSHPYVFCFVCFVVFCFVFFFFFFFLLFSLTERGSCSFPVLFEM